MLNVINIVQQQFYYSSLLNNIVLESYREAIDNSNNSFGHIGTRSMDDVLHNMDQNIFPMLHKLYPKP